MEAKNIQQKCPGVPPGQNHNFLCLNHVLRPIMVDKTPWDTNFKTHPTKKCPFCLNGVIFPTKILSCSSPPPPPKKILTCEKYSGYIHGLNIVQGERVTHGCFLSKVRQTLFIYWYFLQVIAIIILAQKWLTILIILVQKQPYCWRILQNYFYIIHQVTLSVSHDGYLHFGDIVCLHNPSTEATLSANMAESKMHEEKRLVGPCDVSASKMVDPCIRNTFMILG